MFREDVTVLFERMAAIGVSPQSRIFEIGTGWLPIFPLCLALAGFRNIHTVDLYCHLRESAVRRTLLALHVYTQHPSFQLFATPDQVEARYQHLLKSSHILETADITYTAPCDASKTSLKPGSLDLIVSNNVFEHVPQPALLKLFDEAKRLLRPSGHILHCVNCGDHYAYSDPSITQVNYLQYSNAEWARWNNSLQYQNRLRPIDFIQMADGAGFDILSAEYKPNERYLEALAQMEVAPEFRHYSLDQLAATSLTLIASA
ncbi:MAG: methyltransferase domain-containing protein [Acidobacteria bacterium]|nr:methyltransferase domain-containing protein [Acidobacteriota bacterium]